MKTKIAAAALAALACAAAPASPSYFTQNPDANMLARLYFGATAGVAFTNLDADDSDYCDYYYDCYYSDSIDDGASFVANPRIGVEYEFRGGMGFKTEVEGFFVTKEDYSVDVWDRYGFYTTDMSVKSHGVFFNVIGNYHANDVLVPYIGVGLGVAKNEADIDGYSESNSEFAFNIKGGTEIMLNDHFGFDVGLRYANYGTVSSEYFTDDIELDSFDLTAGFNVKF